MVAKLQIQQWLFMVLLYMVTTAPLAAQQADTTILISPDLKQVSLDSLFRYIRNTTGFKGVYSSVLTHDLPAISCHMEKQPLNKVLDTLLNRLGLGYTFRDSYIRLYHIDRLIRTSNKVNTLKGRVLDEQGEPLAGVSVYNIKEFRYVITSKAGTFEIPWPAGSSELGVSHIAYEYKSLQVNRADTFQRIVLSHAIRDLDAIVVSNGYVRSSEHNKSSDAISRVKGEWFRGQTMSNVMTTLSGSVPGLLVTESSGAPGAALRMQIRGRQSIGTTPGSDNQFLNEPLILLNKIRLVTGNSPVTQLSSIAGDPRAGTGGISMLTAINPEDIETVEVLKDANATAIYGPQAANGAILISTCKSRRDRPAFRFNVQTGAATSTVIPHMLDNRQYTAMRKEALAAAGLQPTLDNAPDLLLLDTNNYINIPQLLIGGRGKLINVNASMQGGDSLFRYYLSTGYYRETSVMPANIAQQRLSNYGNLQYRSPGRRLQADLFLYYSSYQNRSLAGDLASGMMLVPLLPQLRDSTGKLTWSQNGFSFINPLAQFENTYQANINVLVAGLQLDYRLSNELRLRTNFSSQLVSVNEMAKFPIAGRDPAQNPTGEIAAARSGYQRMVFNPQLEYEHTRSGDWQWGGITGVTLQEDRKQWHTFNGIGYRSDSALGKPCEAAITVQEWRMDSYHYQGLYSRWQASWQKRFVFTATGRLDRSSRLSSKRSMALFGALAGTWVFSEEKRMKTLPWLSHGKLRASYGAAGNDNYGDNSGGVIGVWQPGDLPNDAVLHPSQLAGSSLGWEKTRKLELSLEWDLLNTLFVNVAWYRNVTSNQFIAVNTGYQAGFMGSSVINWPAKVLNTGWELSVRATHRWRTKNSYTTTLMLTLPRNQLLAFPGLESSAYSTTLMVGQPLSVQQGYRFGGVDPNTGLYRLPAAPERGVAGQLDPRAYGSWSQEWRLGRFRMSVLFDARWQKAFSPLYYAYSPRAPGDWSATQFTNQPQLLLLRWQQPGDQSLYQRFTASASAAVRQALFRRSDAMLVDASFWRIRSLYVGWELPGDWLKKLKIGEGSVYLQGQNLFSGTRYQGGDPTIQYPIRLPSLRMITAGMQIGF
ncbi:MAG: SusC/RagA family TonB-linked outer membrane protein [Niastella sp.]|nr:SusC/RagA family TonB-linked outer membrane protein [Niastella sp.]